MSITNTSFPAAACVFQCSSCRAVLSDSQEFVCTFVAPDGAKCICLRGLSEARVDRIPHNTFAGGAASTSAAARNGSERSTHFTVCCAACGAAVGRLYTEVPAALAIVYNLFCLEADRCLSYELGSAELRAPGSSAAAQQQQQQPQGAAGTAAAAGGAGAPGVDASLVLDLLQRIENLEASLCTLQGMQVLHDTQLRRLPGYQGDAVLSAAVAGGGAEGQSGALQTLGRQAAASVLSAVFIAGNVMPAFAAAAPSAQQGALLDELLASQPTKVLKASGKAEVPSYQEARKLVAAPKPADKKKEEKKKAAPAKKKEEKKAAPKKGSSSSPTFKLDGKVGSGTQLHQPLGLAKSAMIKLAVKPAGFSPLQASRRFAPSRRVATMAAKRVLVPIGRGSEEMEAVITIDVLRRAGAEVTVASVEDSLEVVCARQTKIVADKSIGECAGESWDLIALPGGMPGAERLRDSQPLTDLVAKQKAADKFHAAICATPAVAFEPQGILAGKRATAHPAFSDKLSNQEAVPQRVVVDGKLVTSRGPGTAFEFALALVKALYGEEKMREVAGPMVMRDGWDAAL
ncbi:hypothetical protein COHA_006039 [Chlorella ohadii]|uniref:Mis18 domain-containing protein n=1 Tax=Chlorella ohadii TaxID=2649997 RepID=A0AAD5DLP9_9CHLO|nr:hypothetical protein COHA_006039 [Chlorella ohadii]